MYCSLNQIDDLQSSNKKGSRSFCLPYILEKQNKENFVKKKIRKFVDSGIVKTCDDLNHIFQPR